MRQGSAQGGAPAELCQPVGGRVLLIQEGREHQGNCGARRPEPVHPGVREDHVECFDHSPEETGSTSCQEGGDLPAVEAGGVAPPRVLAALPALGQVWGMYREGV